MMLPGLLAGMALGLLLSASTQDEDVDTQAFEAVEKVRSSLCQERSPCRINEIHDAGVDAKGREITIVELALHDREGDEWKYPDAEKCAPWEVWRVKSCKTGPCGQVKLIELCNDGYGTAGVGEDSIEVNDNELVHGRQGGSAWRWYDETTWQLDPLKVMAIQHDTFHDMLAVQSTTIWDLQSWAGWVEWDSPVCPGEGLVEVDEEDMYSYQPIILATAPEGFLDGAWKTTGLGTCATRIDASGTIGSGWVVEGTPSTPSDGSLSAVLLDGRTLIVEVRDDAWVEGSGDWVTDDHIELWMAGAYDETGQCVLPPPSPLQWGIDLADGAVHAGRGDPKAALSVERHEATVKGIHVVRLKIVLDQAPEMITIVLSDSDDGSGTERLVATSRLAPESALSLGAAGAVPSTSAKCAIFASRLDFVE